MLSDLENLLYEFQNGLVQDSTLTNIAPRKGTKRNMVKERNEQNLASLCNKVQEPTVGFGYTVLTNLQLKKQCTVNMHAVLILLYGLNTEPIQSGNR